MARFTQNAGGTGTQLNYVQVAGGQATVTSAPSSIIDLDITTTGKPVQISVTGEGSNASAGSWVRINLFRDGSAIGNEMQLEASATSENVPYAINFIDNVAAGTYNYSIRATEKSSGNWQFGEVAGPIMNAVELTGFKGDTGDAGSGSDVDIADFIFTDNGGDSTITLPGNKEIKIISGTEEDLYITAGDDLYLQSVDDDIFLQSSDDIRFITNWNSGQELTWRLNSEGIIDLPGNGEIRNTPGTGNVTITGGFEGDEREVFIADGTVPDNKIATIGDITEITPVETDFAVTGGTLTTAPTFNGDPLFSGSYVKTGPLVHFQIQVDMDNITNFGTGQYYVDLPFDAKYGYQFKEGCLHDISTDNQFAIGGHVAAGSNRLWLTYTGSNGQDEDFDHNSPVTLTVDDNFHIAGTYITA